jgi:hypothetical protein
MTVVLKEFLVVLSNETGEKSKPYGGDRPAEDAMPLGCGDPP